MASKSQRQYIRRHLISIVKKKILTPLLSLHARSHDLKRKYPTDTFLQIIQLKSINFYRGGGFKNWGANGFIGAALSFDLEILEVLNASI